MQRQLDREFRDLLVKLRSEHRALDEEIVALEGDGAADQLLIRRLKKRSSRSKIRSPRSKTSFSPTSSPERCSERNPVEASTLRT